MRRFTAEQLDAAKRIDLREFLENHGVQFNRQGKTNSPFREDAHPSFVVFRSTRGDHAGEWVGYDQARGESYDAIRTAQQFLGVDFVSAVKAMLEYSNTPQQTAEEKGAEEKAGIEYDNNGLPAKYTTSHGNTFTYRWIDNENEKARNKGLQHLTEDRRFPPEALDFLLNDVGCRLVEIRQENTAYPPRLYLGIKNIRGGWAFKSLDKYAFNHTLPPSSVSISHVEAEEGATHTNVAIVESLLNAAAWRYIVGTKIMLQDVKACRENECWVTTRIYSGNTHLVTLNSANNVKAIEEVLRSTANRYSMVNVFSYVDFDEAGEKANEKIESIVEKLQGEGVNIELVEIARVAVRTMCERTETEFNALAGGATPIEKIKDLKGCLYVESETKKLREKLSQSQDVTDIINPPSSLEDDREKEKSTGTAGTPSPS